MSTFKATNPATNQELEKEFSNATVAEIDITVKKATAAFKIYKNKDKKAIADFLDQAADEILNLGEELLNICNLETALPLGRLQGERGRTINQLKLFASVVREGSWVDARIDKAQPDRTPIPKVDIRQMLLPLGPVAVFGASNFPLAFSVAGGDTASALAAGCPVVVKAHPAHPETSELVGKAIQTAAKKTGMPEGVFSMVQGNTIEVGQELVKHNDIKAVGFTGSFRGGKALFDLANARPNPIPVFAEMGSTNPVFFLPEILSQKHQELSQGLSVSITLGVGQFCTNPGLVFLQKSDAANTFSESLVSSISETNSGTMLTPDIAKAYNNGLERLAKINGVDQVNVPQDESDTNKAQATIFKTSIADFNNNESLSEENFGPSSILVEANNKEEILEAARNLGGHLTATVYGSQADLEAYKDLFAILEQKAGRVIVNNYPTGVEVCHSMVHGGPYPATTAAQSTSVGTNAIKRFVRPICFQNYPESLLPLELKNDNALNIWRLVDGELTKENI